MSLEKQITCQISIIKNNFYFCNPTDKAVIVKANSSKCYISYINNQFYEKNHSPKNVGKFTVEYTALHCRHFVGLSISSQVYF